LELTGTVETVGPSQPPVASVPGVQPPPLTQSTEPGVAVVAEIRACGNNAAMDVDAGGVTGSLVGNTVLVAPGAAVGGDGFRGDA
jgi:hypothetical protein